MPEVSETTVILPSSGMASAAVAPLPWVGGLMLRRSTSVGENAKSELSIRPLDQAFAGTFKAAEL